MARDLLEYLGGVRHAVLADAQRARRVDAQRAESVVRMGDALPGRDPGEERGRAQQQAPRCRNVLGMPEKAAAQRDLHVALV